MFHGIGHQKHGSYEPVFALLRAQRASMSTQEWAQITFRSEMHLNNFNNESGSELEKGKNQDQDLVICPKHDFLDLHNPWQHCIHIRFLLSNNIGSRKLKSKGVCSSGLK